MEENYEEIGKKDVYMLVLLGVFFLYLWGDYCFRLLSDISGWAWLAFIVIAVVSFVFLAMGWMFSYFVANQIIKYFGLPKNYLVMTIFVIIYSFVMMKFYSIIL